MPQSNIKNNNLLLKKYKNHFNKRYHLNDRLKVVLKIMLDKKPIFVLLKLRFYQISFWFNAFHKDMNDLTNVSNINSDHIKRDLCDVFMMKNCKNTIWIEFIYEIDFYALH
jgi:hypothetical protein